MYAGEIVERGSDRRRLLPLRASVHARPARCDAEPRTSSERTGCSRSKARRRICSRRPSAAATSRAARTRCGSARAIVRRSFGRRCRATRRAAGCTMPTRRRSVERLHVAEQRACAMTALVEADELTKHFAIGGGQIVHARRRRLARDRRKRNRRPRRRERLGQVDVRQGPGRAARQDRGDVALSRRALAAEIHAARLPAPRAAHADDLSGSVLVA